MKSQITNYETACEYLKRDPLLLPDASNVDAEDKDYVIANYKLVIIAKGLIKEYSEQKGLDKVWKADYSDYNQNKYYTWFGTKADPSHPSGFGFSGTGCGCTDTAADVGSRFAFPTSELAIYFGEICRELHLINQFSPNI